MLACFLGDSGDGCREGVGAWVNGAQVPGPRRQVQALGANRPAVLWAANCPALAPLLARWAASGTSCSSGQRRRRKAEQKAEQKAEKKGHEKTAKKRRFGSPSASPADDLQADDPHVTTQIEGLERLRLGMDEAGDQVADQVVEDAPLEGEGKEAPAKQYEPEKWQVRESRGSSTWQWTKTGWTGHSQSSSSSSSSGWFYRWRNEKCDVCGAWSKDTKEGPCWNNRGCPLPDPRVPAADAPAPTGPPTYAPTGVTEQLTETPMG